MRVSYEYDVFVGTINVEIVSKQTIIMGSSDIILSGNSYLFSNSVVSGLYIIDIIDLNNVNIDYPAGTISIYEDAERSVPLKRIATSLYELDAITSVNCDNMVVYLEFGEQYYIDVYLPISDYTNFKLSIEHLYGFQNVDLLYNDDSYTIMDDEIFVGDLFKGINLLYNSSVAITYDYTGSQLDFIYFVLYKEVYNYDNSQYEVQLVFPEMMVVCGDSLYYSTGLTSGRYYIGYYNKTNSTSTITITLN